MYAALWEHAVDLHVLLCCAEDVMLILLILLLLLLLLCRMLRHGWPAPLQ
jgi:ABC-type phosphate transport system auxiliary subunit